MTDLLFATASGIEQTAARIAAATGLTFEWHEGDYRGGDYLRAGDWRTARSEQVIVQRNDDLGALAETIEAPRLVYVESTQRADELMSHIVDPTFHRDGLRRRGTVGQAAREAAAAVAAT